MSVELEVLHCDNHVLATVKPAGVACVPDDSGDESLLDRARAWVGERYAKPGAVFLGVVQRLDRPVSGIVVFGRTSKGAARLAEQFRGTPNLGQRRLKRQSSFQLRQERWSKSSLETT